MSGGDRAGLPEDGPGAPRVAHLSLRDFRSYAALDLSVQAGVVVLVGENGAGKTNLLEALSLFTPGRGLRRADLGQMAREGASSGGPGRFTVAVTLESGYGEHRLGTAFEGWDGRAGRLCRIDGQPAASPAAFAEHLRLTWATPDQDALFRGSAGERRRFLDRLVLAVDAGHGARVSALERSLRSRNRLLEEGAEDARWLAAVERETAELGVAVALARRETVERLQALILSTRDDTSPFPFAALGLEGWIDDLVACWPAVDAEERFRAALREGRGRDRAAGRALTGPQTSDLAVRHGPKDIPAGTASTGEQKALLIGLVLAHARLVTAMSGLAPLVLLDEVAAHLDPRRRAALYDALDGLGGQVWMTGADPALFGGLPASATILAVTPGQVARLT